MTKAEFEEILEKSNNLSELNNDKLVSILENISLEFDITKNSILSLSIYLDKIEEVYNATLKEYEKRTNVRK